MIIDICGFSGAGKTTVQRLLMARLKADGYNVVRYNDLVGKQYMPQSESRFISATSARSFSYFLTKFRFENPEFMRMIDEIAPFEYQEYVLFTEVLASYASMSVQDDPKLATVIDEGIIYRVCVLYRRYVVRNFDIKASAEVRNSCLAEFEQLIKLAPPIDAAVLLKVPPEISRDRAFDRKMRRRGAAKIADRDEAYKKFINDYPDMAYLEFQNELFNIAMRELARNKQQTVIVGHQAPPEIAVEYINNCLFNSPQALKKHEPIKSEPKKPTSEDILAKRKAARLAKRRARRIARRNAAKQAKVEGSKPDS